MRKLMWFTIGFASACLLTITFFWNQKVLLPALIFALCIPIFVLLSWKWDICRGFAVISAGLCVGLVWLNFIHIFYLNPLTDLDGQTIKTQIRASSYSKDSRYSQMFDGYVSWRGLPYQVRVYLNQDAEISPGDTLESNFRFRLTTPGGLKESSFYQGKGFFLVASQKGEMSVFKSDHLSIRDYPAVLAEKTKQIIHNIFSENDAAFSQALLLGDTDELSYSVDTALKVSGIRHIVAVSGLHVTILYGLLNLLFRRKRILGAILSAACLAFFAAIAGFTPSVTRACIMTGMLSLSSLFEREYDAPTALSFACLIMLAVNPFIINSVSFQLSVTSVVSILLFSNPINRILKQRFPKRSPRSIPGIITNWFCGTTAVSISAMIFTTPLTAYYFGTISLIGVITNLLTLWIITAIFIGISISCVITLLWPAAASFLAAAPSFLIHYVLFIAKFLSRFPLAAVYTQSRWILMWLLLCYVLLGGYLVTKKHGIRFLSGGTGALIIAVALSWIIPQKDSCRLTVIDVGEGQSIILQSSGHALLVDCGGDVDEYAADTIAQTLLSQGIFRLDGIALTHYDRDHSGALEYLLTRVSADTLYLPEANGQAMIQKLEQITECDIQRISENTSYSLGTATVSFYQTGVLKTENENCMCVLFDTEKYDILITGDRSRSGEKQLIKQVDLPDVDILIAGHHGSKNSTSEELLQAVTPEIVVISVGASNSYGHPAPELMDRLNEYGCTVFRTDKQGTITIRG